LKGLAKPPGDVVMVTSVVCMFFEMKPDKIKDEANPGKKIDDWWGPSKKLLQNT
jgi:dynein heavy chain